MRVKLGVRDAVISATVFGLVLFALVSVDAGVRDRVSDLVSSGRVTPWGDRVGDLGSAVWDAARTHSLDNAPLLVFATVGTVLTVFMLRS
ncbi:MAG TPA: hypothetical protein VEL79_11880 [Vicinamibacterales bacterium]|nr:hypothetical protein [Vicinamibacterales bacterium]